MIYISEDADISVISYLETKDRVTAVKKTSAVMPQIASHPDVYMCSLNGKTVHALEGELSPEYPGDCRYNAACTGKYLIGNMDILSPRLKEQASDYEFIHVKQGYAKCSTAVIDSTSAITADEGIARACQGRMDILKIRPGHILLPGFDYGFIGGTCGRIGDEIVFCGSVSQHPDGEKIISFITSRGLKIKEFDFQLTDIGSIIYENDL